MFNRNDPISMQIIDPEFPGNKTQLTHTLNVDEDLILFKTDGTYRLLTAETIDPNVSEPKTGHSYEKLFPIGSESKFISRVIIQFEEVFKFIRMKDRNENELKSYLWNTNTLLLNSFNSLLNILFKTDELTQECDDIIKLHKKSGIIPPLPKVKDLDNNVRAFFNNSKLFLIEVFHGLNIFYDMPFKDREAAHFDKHLKWFETKHGSEHPITKLIAGDLYWIRLISECRNAIEHPTDGQIVTTKNMRLLPGNKFTTPSFAYDLTKKLNKKQDGVDLVSFLNELLDNMLHFCEDVLAVSVDENLEKSKRFKLFRIPEKNISQKCTKIYEVGLHPDFQEMLKE